MRRCFVQKRKTAFVFSAMKPNFRKRQAIFNISQVMFAIVSIIMFVISNISEQPNIRYLKSF